MTDTQIAEKVQGANPVALEVIKYLEGPVYLVTSKRGSTQYGEGTGGEVLGIFHTLEEAEEYTDDNEDPEVPHFAGNKTGFEIREMQFG